MKYRDERLAAGLSASSVRNELAILSHLFTIAITEWYLPIQNPVKSIRKPRADNSRSRRLEKDEDHRIISAIREASEHTERNNIWIEYIFLFALETAMRKEEILSLSWDDVNIGEFCARLEETKNGTSRDVPLSDKAIEMLNSMPRSIINKKKVFDTTSSALDQSWRRAVHRARSKYEDELKALAVDETKIVEDKLLKDLHFHDLRHEATSRLAQYFELHELMKITGHKDPRMLSRYFHPKASDLAKKMREKMA